MELAQKYNVHLSVATGGTLARRRVAEAKQHVIIAVACERDLTSGIQDAYPLPVIGVINDRPFGPCFNTSVDITKVAEALKDWPRAIRTVEERARMEGETVAPRAVSTLPTGRRSHRGRRDEEVRHRPGPAGAVDRLTERAMSILEVKVPDIGDFKDVPVIELLVKPGDAVVKEQSLVTLESDKATMEVPATHAGIVKELKVKLGNRVSEGSVILVMETAAAAQSAPSPAAPAGGRHHHPGAGRTADVEEKCIDPATSGRGNPGRRDRDLLRQNRHPDTE